MSQAEPARSLGRGSRRAFMGGQLLPPERWCWGPPPRTVRTLPTPEQLATTEDQIRAESEAALAMMER